MNEPGYSPWKKLQEHWLSRRSLIRGAAGTALGASLFRPKLAHADDDDGDSERAACVGPNPIPGVVMGLAPFGIFIHHNSLNPAKALADINDPSQITDFEGFEGLTHIRGGGMGTDTATGAMTPLAFRPTWVSVRANSWVRTANNTEARSPLFDLTCTPVRLDRPACSNRFTTTTCMLIETTCFG